MDNSRTGNTRRILSSGILNHIIKTILTFVNRTIIIYTLGSEYIGLSGLFSSILQILSVAEFGFNMVMIYYLYEPLAKNDLAKINQVMTWLRSIYHIVGSVIIIGGLIFMPFLAYMIHGEYPGNINIYILFIIYLVDSGISYFLFAYKEVLLIADQKKNVVTNIRSAVAVIISILQLIMLVCLKNFYIYTILLIIGTVSSNIFINIAVTKRYQFLKTTDKKTTLPKDVKKELVGLMINRLSNVSRNSFDYLIISCTLGLIATSVYGNYYVIYSAVLGVTGIVSDSIRASVGNSIAVKSVNENYENLLDFSFLYSWITGWCAVSMACLYQPFMRLWVGEDLMLSDVDMFLFVAYFYLINMNHIRNQYILGNAFWWKLKWVYLAESITNLVLNILLGNLFGITGVLIATIVSIFICNYLICNSMLFKLYFKTQSIVKFYRQQFYYLGVCIIVTSAVYMICNDFHSVIIKFVICLFFPNFFFAALYRPGRRWKSSMKYVRKLFQI